MTVSANIHKSFQGGNLRLSASVYDYDGAPLKISARDNNGTIAEFTFFLDNDALTAALVEAINNAVVAPPADVSPAAAVIEAAGGVQ